VIDVADGTDVDVRLAALEGSGVAPGRVDELCLAPGTESGLEGVGGLLAQSARGAGENPSKRHIDAGARMRDGEEMGGWWCAGRQLDSTILRFTLGKF
jgi:hypothetical protein